MLLKAIEGRDFSQLIKLLPLASPDDRYEGLMAIIPLENKEMIELIITYPCPLGKIVKNDFPLAAASRTGNSTLVKQLLDAGVPINSQCSSWYKRSDIEGLAFMRDGVSALLEAIRYGHEEVFKILLQHKVDVNQKTHAVRRPLDFAIEMGFFVSELEAAGALQFRLEDYTLQEAAQRGVVPRLAQLLDSRPDELSSALANAALNKRFEAVRFLQGHGVRLKGSSVLVSLGQYENIPMLSLLLEVDVELNETSNYTGELALGTASAAGNLETVKRMIKAGANLNGLDLKRLPALHFALLNKHFEIAEYLIDQGADPLGGARCLRHTLKRLDDKNRERAWSLLRRKLTAAQLSQLEVSVGEEEADPTAPHISGALRMMAEAAEGEAGLRHSLSNGTLTLAKLTRFLGSGASLNLRDEEGMWLVDPRGRSFLHLCVEFDRANLLLKCLEVGMPVNLRDQGGFTPLHLAKSAGIVDMLIDAGADPNERAESGERPLHLCNRFDAVQRLIKRGGDPQLTDDEGEAPWVRHLSDSTIKVIQAHAEGGVNFHQAFYGGQSALHLATLGNHVRLVEALLALDIDPLMENHFGQRAGTLARHANHLEILDLLIKAGGEPDFSTYALNLDPKRVEINSLMTGLTPKRVQSKTLSRLRAAGPLGQLLAEAIEGAPLHDYFTAVRLYWHPNSELSPAFMNYIASTLHFETLGEGPWVMYGAARAQLALQEMNVMLDERLTADFPAICVGEQGDAQFWMLARRFDRRERGGWVMTQDKQDRKQVLHKLSAERVNVVPTEFRQSLVEGIQREMTFLDITDLLTLFKVYHTGIDDPKRTLLAALYWSEERLQQARSAGALTFIDRVPPPSGKPVPAPLSHLKHQSRGDVQQVEANPTPETELQRENAQTDTSEDSEIATQTKSNFENDTQAEPESPQVDLEQSLVKLLTPDQESLLAERSELEAGGGDTIKQISLDLYGSFWIHRVQELLSWIAPVLGGEAAPIPLLGSPLPTERSPTGKWEWSSPSTTQICEVFVAPSGGHPGDIVWRQKHLLNAPNGQVEMNTESWFTTLPDLVLVFKNVSPAAFVAAHRMIERTLGNELKPPTVDFTRHRIGIALNKAGRPDLGILYNPKIKVRNEEGDLSTYSPDPKETQPKAKAHKKSQSQREDGAQINSDSSPPPQAPKRSTPRRRIVEPGELIPLDFSDPDPQRLADLARRSRICAQADAREAQNYPLCDSTLIKSIYSILLLISGSAERGFLTELGLNWLTLQSHLDNLVKLAIIDPKVRPIQCDLCEPKRTPQLQKIIKELRTSLHTIREVAPDAYQSPQSIPARLVCLSPIASPIETLTEPREDPVYLALLNKREKQMSSELHHLRDLTDLRGLWLSQNRLKYTQLSSANLGVLKDLQVLDLSRNDLIRPPAGLENCARLEWLDLSYNRRLNEVALLKKCTRLRYLDLRRTAVNNIELGELSRALSGCVILID